MASFFAGASNVTIVGGDFNDVKGNLTIFDYSRHTTNLNSNNTTNNNVLNSHNNNSTTINGEVPAHQMPMPPKSADNRKDHTAPAPPQPPQFPQPSAGGTAINLNSYNVENTNIDNALNNNSQNHYQGSAPPKQTGGPHGSDQFTMPAPFPASLPHQAGGSGPHTSVNSAHIQSMDPHMQRNFEKLLKFTLSQTQSMVAGNAGANYNPTAAYSSLPNDGGDDSMNTGMANLSLDDSIISPMVSSNPQTSPHLSPPPTFSRTKSDPQIGQKTTSPNQMGTTSTANLSPYSNAVQQGSYSNPSLAPHMNEPGMVNFLSLPPESQQYGNNQNRPPPVSTSSCNFRGGPTFNTIHGDLTKHDHREYQTNIDSFNQHNNTIQDSFNDNSYNVNSAGKPSATESNNKRGFPEADAPMETRKKQNNGEKTSPDPTRIVEEGPSDESDDPTPSAAQSTKQKGPSKWFFRRKKKIVDEEVDRH